MATKWKEMEVLSNILDVAGPNLYDNEKAALRFAIRAIQERRELLAALKDNIDHAEGCECSHHKLIAKCEEP